MKRAEYKLHWSKDLHRDITNNRPYPSSFLTGEIKELVDAVKNRDMKNFKEEIGDTTYAAQMLAAQATGLNHPVYADLSKFYDREKVWKDMFSEKGGKYHPDHMQGGSNYAKASKVLKAFQHAGIKMTPEEAYALSHKYTKGKVEDEPDFKMKTKKADDWLPNPNDFIDQESAVSSDSEDGPLTAKARKLIGGMQTASGAIAGKGALERLLGLQTLHHGTSRENAKKIKDTGLLTQFGGNPAGTSAAVKVNRYIDSSKGRVHVAKNIPGNLIARMHANLADRHQTGKIKGNPEGLRDFVGGVLPFKNEGKVVDMVIPHTDFKRDFEADPDHMPHFTFRSKNSIPKEYIKKHMLDPMPYLRALRKVKLLDYIKNNPQRVLRGTALAGLSGLLMSKGIANLKRKVKKEEKEKTAGIADTIKSFAGGVKDIGNSTWQSAKNTFKNNSWEPEKFSAPAVPNYSSNQQISREITRANNAGNANTGAAGVVDFRPKNTPVVKKPAYTPSVPLGSEPLFGGGISQYAEMAPRVGTTLGIPLRMLENDHTSAGINLAGVGLGLAGAGAAGALPVAGAGMLRDLYKGNAENIYRRGQLEARNRILQD